MKQNPINMPNINVRIPQAMLKQVDSLVKKGVYANRTEAFRQGLRLVLMQAGRIPGKPKEISKEEILQGFLKKEGLE